MSQAFLKERDNQWLHEIPPTIEALCVFLSRENNGIFIYDKKINYSEKEGRDVYEMSDGLTYAINDTNQWYVIL